METSLCLSEGVPAPDPRSHTGNLPLLEREGPDPGVPESHRVQTRPRPEKGDVHTQGAPVESVVSGPRDPHTSLTLGHGGDGGKRETEVPRPDSRVSRLRRETGLGTVGTVDE